MKYILALAIGTSLDLYNVTLLVSIPFQIAPLMEPISNKKTLKACLLSD